MSDAREALVALLGRPDHAPMGTHDPRDGSCQSCPWPLHEMPPEDIADAILAEFDVAPRGEGDAVCDKAVTPATAYRVARWRHTRWFEPHLARPTDVYLRPEGGVGAHALYAGCRDCDEVLLPETFESIPPDAAALPSVEDVARRVDEALRPYQVDPSQGPSDAAQDVTRAVLALYPGRTETEVKAEALREAASAIGTYDEGDVHLWARDADTWLLDRADRIEKEVNHGWRN